MDEFLFDQWCSGLHGSDLLRPSCSREMLGFHYYYFRQISHASPLRMRENLSERGLLSPRFCTQRAFVMMAAKTLARALHLSACRRKCSYRLKSDLTSAQSLDYSREPNAVDEADPHYLACRR